MTAAEAFDKWNKTSTIGDDRDVRRVWLASWHQAIDQTREEVIRLAEHLVIRGRVGMEVFITTLRAQEPQG